MNNFPDKLFFDAAIFDLDGILTRTALMHGNAWKQAFDEYLHFREKRDGEPFREFSHEGDYLPYVDGKPRLKGIKSFLESRNIDIPHGELFDSPDKETICGIGNKKNKIFLNLLETNKPEVYESSIELIHQLKKLGIKIGVASSSKNCQKILRSAGIEDLFATRVDGVVSQQMRLKGKPQGDIFVTAAKNLNCMPKRSVVFEDASSGVEAGRNGCFGFVVGVARTNNESELFKKGADIVINDLKELSIRDINSWFNVKSVSLEKSLSNPDTMKGRFKELGACIYPDKINPSYFIPPRQFLKKPKPAFFFDLEKTMISDPQKNCEHSISDLKEILDKLSKNHKIVIMSKSPALEIRNLIGLDKVFYSGKNGLEIQGPEFSRIFPLESFNRVKSFKNIMKILRISSKKNTIIYVTDNIEHDEVFRAIRPYGKGILLSDGSIDTFSDIHISSLRDIEIFFKILLTKN